MSRLLFVHAHPDDETLTCGVAMAHHVARGDEVHVLTCTLGEEGEVIPPGLAHLEGDPDDRLGPYRHGELRRALDRLGVVMHVLGADPDRGRLSRYRDSGMVGSPAAARPEAFAAADLDEAGGLVADLVRRLRVDVVVTYDEHGGYGHPDHIQTHRVTRRALELLAPSDRPGRAFEILTPVAWARDDRRWLQAADPAHLDTTAWWREQDLGVGAPEPPRLVVPATDDPFPPSVVDDALVTHAVVDEAARSVKNAALRAHATQVIVAGEDVHALSNLVAARTTAREGFRRVDPLGWETVGGAVEPGEAGLLG
ncbi:N-acetyl-1-D-myo-inositol-2-amino-2-deoxy-alpha-D -glucopyranoside deacetylase [Terrabacter aerolatus]|uniref:N-acetyl-1-D-myo-inositol-2-amino-2-deoxy-alpha-D-glucopyranoside deacetylase n=1 Tax=Terrabacter aerolatus TaxID=422442 RepID=A0A512D5J5_9MICO|nr:N-acetyl-1-D-myo-inositol-2-amino-2-deoxy-alpha-D-glucopyranoside deacetylase [Terrabacter aerolatus]GEO31722.1 1D-myo-inositol 2-acetamido-2-deoxy-alpha-D-glucopyranoside deacetylase [Terrabacter aerolatus]